MPIIEILGKEVEVGDKFNVLSLDEQQKAVQQIAEQIQTQASKEGASELSALTQKAGGADPTQQDRIVRSKMEASKLEELLGKRSFLSNLSSGLASGLTFGFKDEIEAAMQTPFRAARDGLGLSEAYSQSKALADEQTKRAKEANPKLYMAGEIGGSLAGGVGLAAKGLLASGRVAGMTGGKGVAAKIGAGAIDGAAYSALAGAGNASEGNFVQGAKDAALTGALIGGALPVVGAGIGKAASKFMPKGAPAPTREALAQQADDLYTSAKNAGVTLKPGAMQQVKSNLARDLRDFGFDRDLQPKTTSVLKRIAGAPDDGMTLTELHNLRKIASTAAREAPDASDKVTSGMIVRQIDELIDNADNFSAGSSSALKQLQSGTEVYKRKMKADVLNELNEKAMNQATGYENGLVIQLRSLANNKKRLALFSKAEQSMIKSAVRRGNVRGVLRAIGMLSPTSTFGGVALGGAAIGGGVVPAAIMSGTGYAARKGAEALTRAQFKAIQDAAARGFIQGQGPQFGQFGLNAATVAPAVSGGLFGARNDQ